MQITEDRIIQAEIHPALAFTTSVVNIFRDLHNNSSRPTQPHSIIVLYDFFQDLGSPNFSGSVDDRAPRDREEMQVSRAMASFLFFFFLVVF